MTAIPPLPGDNHNQTSLAFASDTETLTGHAGKFTGRWLTRNVFAIGMLSLFSDAGHELTTTVLPLFLATFGGGAAALEIIEGFSDAGSSVLKLWMSSGHECRTPPGSGTRGLLRSPERWRSR